MNTRQRLYLQLVTGMIVACWRDLYLPVDGNAFLLDAMVGPDIHSLRPVDSIEFSTANVVVKWETTVTISRPARKDEDIYGGQ